MIQRWLVDDWRNFLRWWSVWMTVIGGILAGALSAMSSMPPEIQAAIPLKYRVAAVATWCIASLVVRVAKQQPRP